MKTNNNQSIFIGIGTQAQFSGRIKQIAANSDDIYTSTDDRWARPELIEISATDLCERLIDQYSVDFVECENRLRDSVEADGSELVKLIEQLRDRVNSKIADFINTATVAELTNNNPDESDSGFITRLGDFAYDSLHDSI